MVISQKILVSVGLDCDVLVEFEIHQLQKKPTFGVSQNHGELTEELVEQQHHLTLATTDVGMLRSPKQFGFLVQFSSPLPYHFFGEKCDCFNV